MERGCRSGSCTRACELAAACRPGRHSLGSQQRGGSWRPAGGHAARRATAGGQRKRPCMPPGVDRGARGGALGPGQKGFSWRPGRIPWQDAARCDAAARPGAGWSWRAPARLPLRQHSSRRSTHARHSPTRLLRAPTHRDHGRPQHRAAALDRRARGPRGRRCHGCMLTAGAGASRPARLAPPPPPPPPRAPPPCSRPPCPLPTMPPSAGFLIGASLGG